MGTEIRTALLKELHDNPGIGFRRLVRISPTDNMGISLVAKMVSYHLFQMLNSGIIVAHESSRSSRRFIISFEKFHENAAKYTFSISENCKVGVMASIEYGI